MSKAVQSYESDQATVSEYSILKVDCEDAKGDGIKKGLKINFPVVLRETDNWKFIR